MKQCIVPNWNLSHQRQEQVDGEEGNRSSHVHNPSHLVPMSDYEVAELTWENGQLAMHGLSGLLPSAPTKPTWRRPGDTLESIVHQATFHPQNMNSVQQHDHINEENLSSIVPSSGGKWTDSSGQVPTRPAMIRKWLGSDSDQRGTSTIQEDSQIPSECASASATFCREDDTTILTRDSFKSSRSLKTKKDKCKYVREIKSEADHSDARRSNRVASTHNQSERKRRDRINQKMKALQKLVPNANKTDKASMLDEVIEYLKQLQAQVEMISGRSNVPQMMMSIGMQHHFHQMSLLTRMGMGVGLGMGMGTMDMSTMARSVPPQSLPPLLHPATLAAATPTFVPPPFLLPPPQASSNPYPNASVSLQDQYRSFLAQSMNIDLYNKMAALYQQQVSQTTQATSSSLKSNNVQEN